MAQPSEAKEPAADAEAEPEMTKWRPAFEAVLKNILKEYEGHDDKVRDGMATGMRRLFEQPYKEELSELLSAREGSYKELSLEDAQRIMFYPRLSDMAYYAEAFRRNTSFEADKRKRIMKFKMMSIFYTLHRLDSALAERFVHLGGLASLVALLGEDNNIIQSQAVELLMEMLSPQINMPSATSQRHAHLQHEMYLCLRSEAFWKHVAKIVSEPHEVFPKSHEHTIRMAAGAVGWLRPEDAGAVPEEGPPAGVSKMAEALEKFLEGGPPCPPDTRGLSEDLLDELTQGVVIRADPLKGKELEDARTALFAPATVAREDGAHAWQALKRLGTDAFKAGLLFPADAAYRLALGSGGKVPDAEASLIHSNRALVLLKAGHPAEAAEAAAAALEKDASNSKAAFRQATALLEQSSGCKDAEASAAAARQARDLAQGAVDAASKAADLEPKDTKVTDLLGKAKQRLEEAEALVAAAPAAEPAAAEAAGADGAGLGDMD